MCEFCGCGVGSSTKHSFRKSKESEKPLPIPAVAVPGEPKIPAPRTTSSLPDKGAPTRDPATRHG